ncbi:metal ABC transporter substrate-binding lipoprotein [Lentilactobacillus fungorum]|uniref:Metal ABC transporter substrate-binding lipoprotein n=1 Tax=Lentilactobacillus fungorum TaxID=2201250 RepID=A0ABQ3W2Z7_9LACO|nr:metal ABC transporter substrate-binding protein [Lentilactobacillus fungorum]GHP14909.1 metal ABC transporter substrate-binding lipoprotein [Lentilactobacillus fungorum]
MKVKSILRLALVAVLGVFLTACSQTKKDSKSQSTPGKTVSVVATDTIIGDIANNVAKGHAKVHVIVPTGQDPHEYDPLPDDVSKTAKADLVFYNGLNLENAKNAWFTKMQNNIGDSVKKKSFAVSDGVEAIHLEGKGKTNKQDPHAWLDLSNGIIYAKNIAKQLERVDPTHKAAYQNNLKKYVAKLQRLDSQAKSKFNKIPNNQKLIVTSEGCFKYFSKAYNIPSAYIWEINTEVEGSPDQISTLVHRLKKTKVKSLFVESSVSQKPMKTVARDTGIPIHSTLFTDSIAKKGETGDSYYGMMKWNLEKIAEGLSAS